MSLKFIKVHGSGNTFYLHEERESLTYDWPNLAKSLCHSNNENGADGILVISSSTHADFRMRVYNADGSEASMCGNGLRCVARYVLEKLQSNQAYIETMKANLIVKKVDPIFASIPTFSVQISPISFKTSTLFMSYNNQKELLNQVLPEFAKDIRFTAISVPNPHLIGLVPIQYIEDTAHQEQLADYLNNKNPYFLDGVNVSYIHPVNETSIFVRTFERGVGFTNACGTAMSASALVATEMELVPKGEVTVYNPGGFVKCMVHSQNGSHDLTLIGNATFFATFIGDYDKEGQFQWGQKDFHLEEMEQYEKLKMNASLHIKESWY
jgi:diaminopimelate epimerase